MAKRKIRVNGEMPFGNVCDVAVRESDDATEVSFAADPHGGPESLWFCFRVSAEGSGAATRRVRLTLRHSRNMLGLGEPENARPVVRYADGDWDRLGPPHVETLGDGRRLVSWTIDTPRTHADVAFCYPYGGEEVGRLLKQCIGFWRADAIGVSQGARPLIRLSNDHGGEGSDRPGLYLIARQHSGETPGSWVLDGFLRYIATLGEDAPMVWCVPLTNIDGVEQGDYGKDNFPYDLNRAWARPPMRHETLVFQRDVSSWKARCRGMLGIDFHAPGGTEKDGVYLHLCRPERLPEKHRATLGWAEAIKDALTPQYAAEDFARTPDYPSRWETPNFTEYFCESVDVPAFVVETPYAMVGDLVLTREHYQDIGRRMAGAVVRRLSELSGQA